MTLTRYFRNSFLPLALAFSLVGVTSCELLRKPQLSEIKTCEQLNVEGFCQEDSPVFDNKNQPLFVSANLKNASSNAVVTVEWKYLPNTGPVAGQEIPLTRETIKPKGSDNFVMSSISSPARGWQPGNYQVILTLPDVANSEPSSKEFTINP